MARIARVAILGLVVAMGLRAMGVADDIVNLAFGLVLGAVAVAIALAFGLGGRDAAGQAAQRWADGYLSRQRPPDGESMTPAPPARDGAGPRAHWPGRHRVVAGTRGEVTFKPWSTTTP